MSSQKVGLSLVQFHALYGALYLYCPHRLLIIGLHMKIYFCLLALIILASCSHQPKHDHRTYTEVSCSGIRSWGDCHTQAKEMCPHGYLVGKRVEMRESQTRTMEVACKG